MKDDLKTNYKMIFEEKFDLSEENRCGWIVTEKTKRIWEKELELANELLNVCSHHNLKCVAGYGTMLGAVRHHGFIPWDNDMDFIMPRKDYDLLCNKYADEFKHPFFLQTVEREKNWFRGHATLRNSETTCLSELDKNNYKCNNGIYIDIFPADVEPDPNKRLISELFRFRVRLLKSLCMKKAYNVSEGNPVKKVVFEIIDLFYLKHVTLKQINHSFENLCRKYVNCSNNYRTLSFDYKHGTRFDFSFPHSSLDDLIEYKFENMHLFIPRDYDSWLERAYGDYMKFPPLSARQNDEEEIDPDVPYNEYMKKRNSING